MWLCGSTLHLRRIYCTNQVPISIYIYIYTHYYFRWWQKVRCSVPSSIRSVFTWTLGQRFRQVKGRPFRVQNRYSPKKPKDPKELAPKNWCLEEDVLLTWHVFRWLSFIFEGRGGIVSMYFRISPSQNNSHFQESCQLLRPTSLAYIPTVIVRSSC